MSKKISLDFLLVILILLTFSSIAVGQHSISGFLFSPFPGINIYSDDSPTLFGFGFFALIIDQSCGVLISPLFNYTQHFSTGVSITGGFATFGEGFEGFSLSSIFMFSQKSFKGVDLTGGINFILDDFVGFQAGSVNFVLKSFSGFQVSLLNIDFGSFKGFQVSTFGNIVLNDFTGIQAGLLNINKSFNGFQIGLVNINSQFSGFQIGIVNFVTHSSGFSLGLINIILDGYNFIETSYNELGYLTETIKFGDKRLYTIIGFGLSSDSSKDSYLFKFGLGSHMQKTKRSLSLDIELFVQTMTSNNTISYIYNYYNNYIDEYYYYYYDYDSSTLIFASLIQGDFGTITLRFNLGIPLTNRFYITAGLSYNIGYKIDLINETLIWYFPSELNYQHPYTFFDNAWYGFNLGIQISI